MKHGWARGKTFGFRLVWAASTIAVIAAGRVEASPIEDKGFEIGNGGHSYPNVPGNYTLRMFENYEVDTQGKTTEVVAPPSDGITPRTRLKIDVHPLYLSAEEALESLMAAGKGWVEFSLGKLSGLHREVTVRQNWNRLEMQIFRADDKFIIRLEGDKTRSNAYQRLAESLLSEIEEE